MPTPDFSKVWASNSPLPEYTFSDADYITGWDFVGAAPPTKNEFDAWFKLVDEKLNWLYGQLQSTAAQIYPVGSVYMSFDPTDPTNLFGGTWTRLKDRMLMASGDVYAPNSTGGSATVTLTTSQLPSHNHSLTTDGSHTHTATNANAGTHNHTVTGTTASNGSHTHTWSGSSASAGTHAHTWSGSAGNSGDHTHAWSGSSASAGAHTHTTTIASSGVHTHTATSATAGSHTHEKGSMNITGSIVANDTDELLFAADEITKSGALSLSNKKTDKGWVTAQTGGVAYQGLKLNAADGWTGSTSTNGDHTHTITVASAGSHVHTATVASNGAHTHTLSGTNASNGTHTHTLSGTVASNGAHTHTLSGTNASNGAHTHTWSGSIANSGSHTHTITVVANGNHTHTVGNTGGGLPVNILPPYQTVYMWRRTA